MALQTIAAGATAFGSWTADSPITDVGPGATTAVRASNTIALTASFAALPDGWGCVFTSTTSLPTGLTAGRRYFAKWTTQGAGPYTIYSDRAMTTAVTLSSAGVGVHTCRPWSSKRTPVARWITLQRHVVRGIDGTPARLIGIAGDLANTDHIVVKLDNGTGLTLTATDYQEQTDLYCDPPAVAFTANANTDQITLGTANTTNETFIRPVFVTTNGALPGGLTGRRWYFTRFSSTTVTKLFATPDNAAANTSPINITSAGSGTHTLTFFRSTAPAYWFLLPANLTDGIHALRAYVYPKNSGKVRILQGTEDATYLPGFATETMQAQSLQVYGDLSNTLNTYVVISGDGSSHGTPTVYNRTTNPDPSVVTGKYASLQAAGTDVFDNHGGSAAYNGITFFCEAASSLNTRIQVYRPTVYADVRPLPAIAPGSVTVTGTNDSSTNSLCGWTRFRGLVFTLDAATALMYFSGNDTVHHNAFWNCHEVGPGSANVNGGLFTNAGGNVFYYLNHGCHGMHDGPAWQASCAMSRGCLASDFGGDMSEGFRHHGIMGLNQTQLGGQHSDGCQNITDTSNGVLEDVYATSPNLISSFYQGEATANEVDAVIQNVYWNVPTAGGMGIPKFPVGFVIRNCTFVNTSIRFGAAQQMDDCEVIGCSSDSAAAATWSPTPGAPDQATYDSMDWRANHNTLNTNPEATDTIGDPLLDTVGVPTATSGLIHGNAIPTRAFDLQMFAVGNPDDVGSFNASNNAMPPPPPPPPPPTSPTARAGRAVRAVRVVRASMD